MPSDQSKPFKYVQKLAGNVAKRRFAWGYVDDLVGVGCERLCRPDIDRLRPWKHYIQIEGAMLDWLRAERRHCHQEMDHALLDKPAETVSPHEQFREHQREKILRAKLLEMPLREQRAFEGLLDGDTQKSVAQKLGVPQQRICEIKKRVIERVRPHVAVAQAA